MPIRRRTFFKDIDITRSIEDMFQGETSIIENSDFVREAVQSQIAYAEEALEYSKSAITLLPYVFVLGTVAKGELFAIGRNRQNQQEIAQKVVKPVLMETYDIEDSFEILDADHQSLEEFNLNGSSIVQMTNTHEPVAIGNFVTGKNSSSQCVSLPILGSLPYGAHPDSNSHLKSFSPQHNSQHYPLHPHMIAQMREIKPKYIVTIQPEDDLLGILQKKYEFTGSLWEPLRK